MSGGVWTPRTFEPIVERLRLHGANARLPNTGEDLDTYFALVFGWMLDVLAPNEKAKSAAYWRMKDPAFRDEPPLAVEATVETPKRHITEQSGRSFRIEGAVQDGKVYKPGEPLPPRDEQ